MLVIGWRSAERGPMTPMMEQYRGFKARHQGEILLFRLGDFFEMFYEDAQTASRVLGLTLTARRKEEEAVPMAGFPAVAADGYVKRLVRAGFRVAICDQVQDAGEATGLVDRDVVEVVTAGTLTDERMLDAKESNWLLAVCPNGDKVGLSWLDLSTGQFRAADAPNGRFLDEAARIGPAECLVPEGAWREGHEALKALERALPGRLFTPFPDLAFDRGGARRALLEQLEVATLEGFGCEGLGPSLQAAGALVRYVREAKKNALAHLTRIERFEEGEGLSLDRATRDCLEIVETIRGRERRGSLLSVLDRTRTAMGARLLREWLLCPLGKVAPIALRQDAVAELVADPARRERLQGALGAVHDIERLTAKVGAARANGRDLLALRQSLEGLPAVREALEEARSRLLREEGGSLAPLPDVAAEIARTLVDDPPVGIHEGGLIRDGVDEELDRVRAVAREGTGWIARFQAEEQARTGIASLKVGYNQVFGYYIEVTNTHREKIPENYIRKQTLKNAERYITPEMKERETAVLHAREASEEREHRLFVLLRERVAREARRLQDAARRLALLDAVASLAAVAAERGYVRPTVNDGDLLRIADGRHPVLEAEMPAGEFVPNDVALGGDGPRVLLITGPNMAGKSTYMRQVALIALMAQVGSFVPAREAEVGIADRIFTRVGASDELSKGLSTFMVEMTETANILNRATERSLVVLDEVGRGTSTYDGVSIAWAVTEHLHDVTGARTLFATHYHELTDLPQVFPKVKNVSVAVREWGDEICFLRKIVDGPTDKSYGIHVARLAGIPRPVIERARQVLAELEGATLDARELPRLAPKEKRSRKGPRQLSLFAPPEERLLEALRALDLSNLTPQKALQRLSDLQSIARR